jgi:hypothetical protein
MSRDASDEPVSTADPLDQLVFVGGPHDWPTVVALALLLAAFTLWGCFGRMTTRIEGRAVLRSELASPGGPLKLDALVYVNGEEGKRIRPGMRVHLAPAAVSPERWGYLIAEVGSIREAAPTAAKMQTPAAAYEVIVRLLPDLSSPSGYAWTTGRGPVGRWNDNGSARAFILVGAGRPIEKILPALRRTFTPGPEH